jgi:sporulation protein YlmC with PRC-barrel domain
MKTTPRLLSSSSITGTSVKNAEGKDIGKIKDLMIDHNSGEVSYAVLSFGGFLGMGDKLFAIPMQKFEFDTADRDARVVLNISKEKLEKAPGFDKDDWPNHASTEFTESVYRYYGVESRSAITV